LGKESGMPQYREQFLKGSLVRVKNRAALLVFQKEWRLHNPLQSTQLFFAGKEGEVAEVSYYHGGDVLYTVAEMPGVWHEQCLELPE
jgi:hypothetical protein